MNYLKVAGFDRYDFINNVKGDKPAFTIWFAGCTHRCKGCHNEKLWDKNSGIDYPALQLSKLIHHCKMLYGIKDVCLLGGEPLQQDGDELYVLCKLLKESDIDIWLYTGYDIEYVINNAKCLPYLHTIKCGKYDEDLRQDGFPSSSNQLVYRRNNAGDWESIKL